MNQAIRTALALGAAAWWLGASQPACGVVGGTPCGTFTEYPVPYAAPHGIVYVPAGPLTGLWVTNRTLDKTSGVFAFSYATGKTTMYLAPTPAAQPGSINFIPGRNDLWFTESNTDKIGRIDSATRKITEYAVPTKGSKPLDIQHGPDASMWFTESGAGKLGRIDLNGKVTEFAVGNAGDEPTALIERDGAMWFTEVGTGRIGRFVPGGALTHFSTGPGKLTGDITDTNDGALWAGKKTSVVRLRTDGALTEFQLPAGTTNTGQIFGHGDGVFMGAIKSDGQGAIVSVSSTGKVVEYDLPRKYLLPSEMAVDPHGGYFVAVESVPVGHSVSMVWRLQ